MKLYHVVDRLKHQKSGIISSSEGLKAIVESMREKLQNYSISGNIEEMALTKTGLLVGKKLIDHQPILLSEVKTHYNDNISELYYQKADNDQPLSFFTVKHNVFEIENK